MNLARICIPSMDRAAFYVVHSYNWKFLGSVHNLFTCARLPPSPAGLRVEISCETDKKKINFIFNCSEKISLTKKLGRACPHGKRTNTALRENFRASRPACIPSRSTNQVGLPILCGISELTELVCARNFPPLPADGKRSVNCRCSELIVTSWGKFFCAAPVGTGR